jgi:WXG100 family type VII secretion target
MSAASDLAQYAGGDAVLTEANKVEKANPETISAAATRLSTAAGDITNHGNAVGKAVKGLDDAWQGASADQFVAYMNQFGKAGTDIGTSMNQAAEALGNAAEAITSAKNYISGRCDQALTEIRNWIKKNNDADQSRIDAYTRDVCNGVAGDIRTHLQGTEAALSAAAGALAGAKNPASRFSAVPDPSTQAFVPQPGKPIEWTATPPGQTNPSSTGDQRQPATNNTGSGSGGSGSGGSGSGGGGGGGGGGLGPSGGPPAGGPPPGNVQEWIKQAIEILRQNGINVSEEDAQRIWQIIQHESGGNPQAINNWDSNAARGTPSKGLMQCIDPTFNSYKLPGHNDIWNPVDNICAGVNYAISRYGSLANVPGIKAMASGGDYRGY